MNVRISLATAAAATALLSGLAVVPASAASATLVPDTGSQKAASSSAAVAKACQTKTRTVWVRGTNSMVKRGEGAVTLCTGGGKLTINGWVKDNRRDGRCAQLYGTTNKGQSWSKKACGKGTLKDINYTFSGASSSSVLLRVI